MIPECDCRAVVLRFRCDCAVMQAMMGGPHQEAAKAAGPDIGVGVDNEILHAGNKQRYRQGLV